MEKYKYHAFIGIILLFAYACNANGNRYEHNESSEILYGASSADVIRDISRQYHKKILKTPYVAPAIYFEKAKCGDSYCMFTEGEGLLHSDGYDTLIPIANFTFLPELLFKSDRKEEWYEYLRFSKALYPNYRSISDLQLNAAALFSAFRFFETEGPLSAQRRFNLEQVDVSDDKAIMGIVFSSDNRQGTLYYNTSSKLPAKIELTKIPFYSVTHQRWVNASGHFSFTEFESNLVIEELFLTYSYNDVEYSIGSRFSDPIAKDIEQLDKYSHSRIMANNTNPFIGKIKDLDQFTSKFEFINLEEVRLALEDDKSLEQQFMENSGMPFVKYVRHDGTKTFGHEGERAFEFTREFMNRFGNKKSPKGFQPSLKIYNRWIDFGYVNKGSLLKAEYILTNTSYNTVNIVSVNPACIFNEYEIDQTKMEPNESVKLTVYLTPNFNGYLKEYIYIETDTYERYYSLVFEAVITN